MRLMHVFRAIHCCHLHAGCTSQLRAAGQKAGFSSLLPAVHMCYPSQSARRQCSLLTAANMQDMCSQPAPYQQQGLTSSVRSFGCSTSARLFTPLGDGGIGPLGEPFLDLGDAPLTRPSGGRPPMGCRTGLLRPTGMRCCRGPEDVCSPSGATCLPLCAHVQG